MTKKIWIIEEDNSVCWNKPIIKFSKEEAMDYVANEFEDVIIKIPDLNNRYWEIEDGTGTASVSDDCDNYYNWRITEHEIEFDIVINVK